MYLKKQIKKTNRKLIVNLSQFVIQCYFKAKLIYQALSYSFLIETIIISAY